MQEAGRDKGNEKTGKHEASRFFYDQLLCISVKNAKTSQAASVHPHACYQQRGGFYNHA